MAPPKPEASIIIKRIKKGGHGHHGGAWKVAYADFVTAMMAFFLLLWLLSTMPSEKLEGISDYFMPTIGLAGQMGIGFDGGQGDSPEGTKKDVSSNADIVFGSASSGDVVKMPEKEEQTEAESQALTQISKDLEKSLQQKEIRDAVKIDMIPEGLRIQVMDQDKRPLFEAQTAKLTPHAENVLAIIGQLIKPLPNYLSIAGHTDATLKNNADYSNWELSSDRANAARRFLLTQKVDPERIAWIQGKADFDPLDFKNPLAPNNRRVSIVLLRNSILPYHKQAIPKEILNADPNKAGVLDQYLDIRSKDNLPAQEAKP